MFACVDVADGASGWVVMVAARCVCVWQSVFAFATRCALSVWSVVGEEEGSGVVVGLRRVARCRGLRWVPGGRRRRGSR